MTRPGLTVPDSGTYSQDRQFRGGPATHGKRRATMSALTLAVFLLGQAAPATAPGTEVRALTVTLLGEKDQEVTDISAADVALAENGVSRDITSFKPDRRPLSVAVIVDTSAAVGSAYRLNVVDAVVGLVARLPEGARYALWTTGDRPTKVVDHTDDRQAAGDGPAARGAPGRQLPARRLRRGLGRPQEALPRGRPHRGGGGDRHGAGAQLPATSTARPRRRRRTPSCSCPSRSTRATPTSRCART